MFPLQPIDELVFETLSTSQHDQFLNDLIVNHDPLESNIISFSGSSNPKQLSRKTEVVSIASRDDCNTRRIKQRDMERTRRQELSILHLSLQSLLPLEHIKGKRSICNHIEGAVNYIKHMQKNIEDLKIRRDNMKKISNLSDKMVSSSNGSQNLPNCVTVNLVGDGLEILITNSDVTSGLGLSKVMSELMERELDVVNCVSTKTNGRFLHKILAEIRDKTSLDLQMLRECLTNAINWPGLSSTINLFV